MIVAEFETNFEDMATYFDQALYFPYECWKSNKFKIDLQGNIYYYMG